MDQHSTDSGFVTPLNINEMTGTSVVPVIYKEEKKKRYEFEGGCMRHGSKRKRNSRHASHYQE